MRDYDLRVSSDPKKSTCGNFSLSIRSGNVLLLANKLVFVWVQSDPDILRMYYGTFGIAWFINCCISRYDETILHDYRFLIFRLKMGVALDGRC
jgi:hypothetical protein